MDMRKGEHVLHAQHGIGKIESIRDCSFGGQAPASYAQLYFERDGLTMTMLEVDLPSVVRRVISPDEAEDLLDQLSAWNGKSAAQWKARANAHQAAIDSGDPFEYVKVLKGLTHLESQGTLRTCDREHLNRSLYLIREELACALNKSPRQVGKLIDRAIGSPA